MSDQIRNLIKKIQRYDSKKHDVIAPLSSIVHVGDGYVFNDKPVEIPAIALRMLLSLMKIPAEFFMSRLTPKEQASIFNRIAKRDSTDYMLRFMRPNELVGVVSSRYSKLDNVMIVDMLRNAAKSGYELVPGDVDLNPWHARIQITVPQSQFMVGTLIPQLLITNSETGLSALQVHSGCYRVQCSNGLVVPVGDITQARWIHFGSTAPDLNIDMHAIMHRSVDFTLRLAQSQSVYLPPEKKIQYLHQITGALGQETANKIVDVANAEYDSGRTLFGLVNSITRAAQEYEPATRTHMETYASTLLQAS